MRPTQSSYFLQEILTLSSDSAHSTDPFRVLEIGSGDGRMLDFLRNKLSDRFELHGIDYSDTSSVSLSRDYDGIAYLHRLASPTTPYPFPDNYFDLVFSNQVLEHVETIDFLFSQLSRILKPSGISLHLYPSRRILIEPHCKIPFVHLLPNRRTQYLLVKMLYPIFNPRSISSKSINLLSSDFAAYISIHTFYRTFQELRISAATYDLLISDVHPNPYMLCSLPFLRSLPLPFANLMSFAWSLLKSSTLSIYKRSP